MDTLYNLLLEPSKENLHFHSIHYFDDLIKKYPTDYQKIITYINEVYNYESPLIVKEKDWGSFMMERYTKNRIPEEFLEDILRFESEEFTLAVSSYFAQQKQSSYSTIIAKMMLKENTLNTVRDFKASMSDKQKANEMLSSIDGEINEIHERLRQDQNVFGNFKGYEQVKTARNKHKINIANYID